MSVPFPTPVPEHPTPPRLGAFGHLLAVLFARYVAQVCANTFVWAWSHEPWAQVPIHLLEGHPEQPIRGMIWPAVAMTGLLQGASLLTRVPWRAPLLGALWLVATSLAIAFTRPLYLGTY